MGCTGMIWSIHFLQAEEAQGTTRACKKTLIHEPDMPWCPQGGGDEKGHEKQVLGAWQSSGVHFQPQGGFRDPAFVGLGHQCCFQGALQGEGWESL